MKVQLYSDKFYNDQEKSSIKSANEIVPLVLSFIKPKSVIDIGCGVGTWLSVFKKYGVSDIMGVDGNWVKKEKLYIPQEKFLSHDLNKPLKIKREFDLAVSLEVAEHLYEENASVFIDLLTSISPIVLFSAAIPFQGGTNHINEQWPEYWVELFKRKGYVVVDCIRKRIWNNKKIAFFYAQNILLFIKENHLKKNKKLMNEWRKTNIDQLSIVHPEKYILISKERRMISRFIPMPFKKLRLALLSLQKNKKRKI